MNIKELTMEKPFQGLFPIKEDIVSAIRKDMEAKGYDLSYPVVIWNDKNIVIDGNTRVLAAKLAGIDNVPATQKDFKDEAEALRYAIHNQRDRRNMTDADILRCVEAVDERKPKGGDHTTEKGKAKAKASSDAIGKSAKKTAGIVGTSERKVEKARTILDHADDKTKQEVIDGKKSIHRASKETRESPEENHKAEEVYKKFHSAVGSLTRIIYKAKCSTEPISSQAIFFAINSIRGTVIKQIDGTEDKIMLIEDVGWLMASNYQYLHGIKPLIKKYLKNLPKDKEKLKAVDHFISWLKAWQKEAVDILSNVPKKKGGQ